MIQDIYSFAHDIVKRYKDESNEIDVVEGLSYNMYTLIREAEFLSSGHYMNGDYDEDGNLRPFHDIITRILENQRTAEEIDTADFNLATNDQDFATRTMLLDKYNREWMDTKHLDQKINDAIEFRGKYGGVLIKVLEWEDDIDIEVVDWTQFSGDEADLESGVKVITHYYTPAQLMAKAEEMGWDMEMARAAIELYAEASQEDSEFYEQRETTGKYVLVREVHGTLSRQYMDDDADEHSYSLQLHYLAGTEFMAHDGTRKAVTLNSVELDQSPFYYLPYKKRGGNNKLLGIGQVERAKHAQVQTNRAAQNWKTAMDYAATHVLQSSSKNLKGKNVLTNIKKGTIIHTDQGSPISAVDMSPQALQHFGNYLVTWQSQVDRATGTTAIGTGQGEKLPADMTYRLGAILDQNAQSPFDLRREEMGILFNRIWVERVIPFHISKIKNSKELKLKFNPDELQRIDFEIETMLADEEMINAYFDGVYADVSPVMRFQTMLQDRQMRMEQMDTELKKGKNRRTIKNDMENWREYWDELNGKVFVEITNEKRKKNAMLESANNVMLQYLQFKPQFDQDPEARKLLNNIIQMTGLDPIDFSNTQPLPAVNAGAEPMKEEQPLATSAKPR